MRLQIKRIGTLGALLPSWASRSIILRKRLLSSKDPASPGMCCSTHNNTAVRKHQKPESVACLLATAAGSSIFVMWKTLNGCRVRVTGMKRTQSAGV